MLVSLTMALILVQERWLSWAVFYGTFAVNLVLDAWLLTMLYKQSVKKQLPWFVAYVIWELLATIIGLTIWPFSRRLYVTAFWWMEAIRVALIIGAVRESLLRIFEGFKSLLRWSVIVVIVSVVLYSAWKAVHAPPVQSNRLISFILGAEFTFRWGIAAVTIFSGIFMWMIHEPTSSREGAVVSGFGVASIAFVGWVLSRSFFGTRFTFLTEYLPDVGYFAAAFLWIRVFSRPVEEVGFKELGMGPEDIARELRRYREVAEQIVRKIYGDSSS